MPEATSTQSPEVVIRTILALVALLALAYVGGHPRLRELERRLRISQIVTAGVPFLGLGLLLSLPSVGVLTGPVLDDVSPVLRFGLGWIGFTAGFRLDVRQMDDLPKGTAAAVGFATALPFALIVIGAGPLLLFAGESGITSLSYASVLRDALILGTAGAMTARQASRLLESADGNTRAIFGLEELAGIAGLAFIAAYFRPVDPGDGWLLPGTAWLFLTVGLGAVLGVVAYVILWRPASKPETALLLIGSVAFTSGMATVLHMSPIVVCFVAGALLTNFPGDVKGHLRELLLRLERPIYLLFLVVAGALWHPGDPWGWVLLAVFLAARLAGKWLGQILIARTTEAPTGSEHWLVQRGPIGQLSIAIVVSAQLLFPDGAIALIDTAVIGGAILMELVVQILARSKAQPTANAEAPTSTEPPAALEPGA